MKIQQNTLDRVNFAALILNTRLTSSPMTIQTPLFLRTSGIWNLIAQKSYQSAVNSSGVSAVFRNSEQIPASQAHHLLLKFWSMIKTRNMQIYIFLSKKIIFDGWKHAIMPCKQLLLFKKRKAKPDLQLKTKWTKIEFTI